LFEHIVAEATQWGGPEQISFVVGATQPRALARVRNLLAGRPHWILAPGVGAQGGDLTEALAAGLDDRGSGLIVPVSRHVLYVDDPRGAALALRDAINEARMAASSRQAGRSAHALPDAAAIPRTELILHLHDAGCVQFGEFTLASGLQSPIYLDLRRMASDPVLLRRAAQAYADLLQPLRYERLAAVPYAALTIGTAVALATASSLIYPRKEVKAYGTGKTVEGIYAPGERAVVVEDLVTSGGSVLTAIATLEAAGLVVRDVVVLIDREQGGPEALAADGYRLHAALTMTQILDVLHAAGRISFDQAKAVADYLASTKSQESMTVHPSLPPARE
jgi:uridine monophosphate synthetase